MLHTIETDIRELDLETLRDAITIVNQDYALPGVGPRKYRLGAARPDARDERIMRAAGEAGLRPLIERWPQGLETPLAKQIEHELDLSGGSASPSPGH